MPADAVFDVEEDIAVVGEEVVGEEEDSVVVVALDEELLEILRCRTTRNAGSSGSSWPQ